MGKKNVRPWPLNGRRNIGCCLAALSFASILWLPVSRAQSATLQPDRPNKMAVGDAPAAVPALATDLSPALNPRAVDKAVRKVGDWELNRSQRYFNRDWTFAVLYTGFMAAAERLPNAKYQAAMLQMGNKFNWQLDLSSPIANNPADYHAIGQTYLDLYRIYHQPRMIRSVQATFDRLMKVPDDPAKPVWWWADALFMDPPTWVRMYRVTGNRAYLDYMDREFWITSNLLYRPEEKLYSRDATYLQKKDTSGKPIFWARGNGWVMAGIARTLEDMPKDYPSRAKYIHQFQQMASRVASLQGRDGLWRTDLLDRKAYPEPETSGTSLFVFAFAWGIDHGILDRATYLPVVEKGWKGLLGHVYQDGRLGSVQPVGAEPVMFPATSSYVYGVGGFLLAGAELHRLSAQDQNSSNK